ncbi:hypothetical protein ABTY96_46865 [Streptomyces sp. NPDC096057]|uniref:hypothetical protein n=1 Tax=Streptomyces sp. NPDC096057 TaxID=3155543 RepID=UPI003333FD4C
MLHSAVLAQSCLPYASVTPELRAAVLSRLDAEVGEAGTPWAVWAGTPMAALFLEAVTWLEGASTGVGESPRGCYVLGPASLPTSLAGRDEDRMCVNGAMLASSYEPVDDLLHQMMQVLFPVLTPSEENWGPGKHARVWRGDGDVLAVTQILRLSGRPLPEGTVSGSGPLPGNAASTVDAPSRERASYLGFYYVSESALRLLGGR